MEERKILTLPSQIQTVRRYADNSAGISFRSTLEVSTADMMVLDAFLRDKTPGHLQFARNRLSVDDVPKEDAPDDGKSQSQIIRGLLWHIWDKKTDHSEDSEAYIRRRRARLIEFLKQELDD